jgi:hypothetical protein
MKTILSLFMISGLGLLMFCSCSEEGKENQTASFPDSLTIAHSVKGWEIYSWSAGNVFYYSLLTGTNRLKSYDEVTANKIVVAGLSNLKILLDKFPENESVTLIGEGWLKRTWGDNFGDLKLPPQDIIDAITSYSLQRKLLFRVIN